MNPYFQQPQLWVNTNKSTMIVLGRLCIMYRMNNGNSQSRQCISHFFLKCRHIFQAIRAWVVFFPMWIIKRPVKGHWLISSPRSGGKLGKKKNVAPTACLPTQFESSRMQKARQSVTRLVLPRAQLRRRCAHSCSQTPSNGNSWRLSNQAWQQLITESLCVLAGAVTARGAAQANVLTQSSERYHETLMPRRFYGTQLISIFCSCMNWKVKRGGSWSLYRQRCSLFTSSL